MNPGYLAAIVQIAMIVLVLCGWRRELGGDLGAGGLVVFLAIGLLASGVVVSAGHRFAFTLSEPVYLAAVLYAFYRSGKPGERLRVGSVSALLVLFAGLAAYVQRWSSFAVIAPELDYILGSAMIAACLLRAPEQQFAALWFGFSLGGLWEQSLNKTTSFQLGDAATNDGLWLSLLSARVVSLVIEWTTLRVQRSFDRNK